MLASVTVRSHLAAVRIPLFWFGFSFVALGFRFSFPIC
jgi:hypothetical protein